MAGASPGEPDGHLAAVAAEYVFAPAAGSAADAAAPTADFAQRWPAVVPLADAPVPAAGPVADALAVAARSASAAAGGIADPAWHSRSRERRAGDVAEDPSHVPEWS